MIPSILVEPLFDDVLHDRQRREHARPAGIEGELRENLSGLLWRQSVVHRPAEMVGNLGDLAGSDQGTDRRQAAIARRQVRTQPQVAEQNLARILDDSRSNLAELRADTLGALPLRFLVERERSTRSGRQLVAPELACGKD